MVLSRKRRRHLHKNLPLQFSGRMNSWPGESSHERKSSELTGKNILSNSQFYNLRREPLLPGAFLIPVKLLPKTGLPVTLVSRPCVNMNKPAKKNKSRPGYADARKAGSMNFQTDSHKPSQSQRYKVRTRLTSPLPA